MSSAGQKARQARFRPVRALTAVCAVAAALSTQACFSARQEPDTVSETRSPLIAAAGGFICLYREGASPADLLYVKEKANEAGFQVVFKIAESEVIPEAIRKGWGDVAIGFTEAETKKLGLRVIPLPRRGDDPLNDDGTGVMLLRSADDFLDALLNPEKKTDLPSPAFP